MGSTTWRDARRVLHGPLRTLVAGQAAGSVADGLAQISFAQLVVFEVEQGATPARLAAVLAVTLLPFSLVGPFAGVVIDRWSPRSVLVVVSIARLGLAVAAVGIALSRNQPLAFAGILLLLSSSRFVLAAKGAALPATVPAADLVPANAVSAVVGMVAVFAGAVVGATFVGWSSALGFGVAAAGYLLATGLYRRLPPVGVAASRVDLSTALARTWADLREGARALWAVRGVRVPLGAVAGHRFWLGAGFVVLVLTADTRYDLEAAGYGIALVVTGAAAFVATLAAPRVGRRHDPRLVLPMMFVVAGLAATASGLVLSFGALVTGLAVAAFAFQTLKVLVDALVGAAAPPELRGRAFAAYDVAYNLAFVLAALALVPLWEPGRERLLLLVVGVGFLASAPVVRAGLVVSGTVQPPRRGNGRTRRGGSPGSTPS